MDSSPRNFYNQDSQQQQHIDQNNAAMDLMNTVVGVDEEGRLHLLPGGMLLLLRGTLKIMMHTTIGHCFGGIFLCFILHKCKVPEKFNTLPNALVVEKAKSVYANWPSINELIGTLPSLFHIELIDVSESSAPLSMDDLTIDKLSMNWKDIYCFFPLILGFWRGKKATTVEDQIVGRYVFNLCWDIPYIVSEADILESMAICGSI
ncbi:hypothetical protein KIW84_034961 [Lathyrus oleraceus]|uniref:Uncharacterized protein n=1 Tax=Pisum sativum TaxID=3888 RepID=A0A9D5B5Y9_PEA|nr:hypothetical protein KIW84_034961 [Pisum sativum]